MKFLILLSIFLLNIYQSQEVFNGYTLFTPQQGNPNSGAQTLLLNNYHQHIL